MTAPVVAGRGSKAYLKWNSRVTGTITRTVQPQPIIRRRLVASSQPSVARCGVNRRIDEAKNYTVNERST